MNLRSFLFTPSDSQKKMERGATGPADALILDLEDSVAEANRPAARSMVREFLAACPVRISSFGSESIRSIHPMPGSTSRP